MISLLGLTLAVALGALWMLRAVRQSQSTTERAGQPAAGGQRTETLDPLDHRELDRLLEQKGAGRRR